MSLYDVLGVAPSATADALHHAYRERARALHPDRHADAPTEQRRQADVEMRELNAAWQVLSDPARRTEYDRSLAPRPPLPPQPRGDTLPAPEEEDAEYDSRSAAWLARMIAVVMLLAVLGFIVVFTAFALHGPDDEGSSSSPGTTTGDTIAEVGDCVRVRGGHVSEIVACGQPNDGEVRHVIDRNQPCPDDTRRIDGSDGSSALCLTIV